MNKKVLTVSAIAFSICFLAAKAQTVHEAIDELRTYCATSSYGDIEYVKEWGFSPKSYMSAPFINAVEAISNHWQEALADWGFFATNEEHRLLFRHLVGFAGTNAFIGVWNRLIDLHEADARQCAAKYIREVRTAASTPLEDYVFLNYQIPAISNSLIRSRALYSATNADMQVYFDEIFTGYRKEEIEDERALDNADWSK